MECLTATVSFDIFMNNYFTSFRLLTHLGVNKIRATIVLNKNRSSNGTIIAANSYKKKGHGHYEQCSAHQAKLQCNLSGWLDQQQGS